MNRLSHILAGATAALLIVSVANAATSALPDQLETGTDPDDSFQYLLCMTGCDAAYVSCEQPVDNAQYDAWDSFNAQVSSGKVRGDRNITALLHRTFAPIEAAHKACSDQYQACTDACLGL